MDQDDIVDVTQMIFAASYVRQVHDFLASGRGAPDEKNCIMMVEEALAVAEGGIEALNNPEGGFDLNPLKSPSGS